MYTYFFYNKFYIISLYIQFNNIMTVHIYSYKLRLSANKLQNDYTRVIAYISGISTRIRGCL